MVYGRKTDKSTGNHNMKNATQEQRYKEGCYEVNEKSYNDP